MRAPCAAAVSQTCTLRSAVPVWYKQRNGGKMHVLSGAARVAKFRPGGKSQGSFY